MCETSNSLNQTNINPQQLRKMEQIANLHIEKLPEGVYLATSDDIPGLVAQGRTVTETIEIARDVAKKLLEAQAERNQEVNLTNVGDEFDYPLVIGS
jgi:predicted RNase H-like HicB family nuclease